MSLKKIVWLVFLGLFAAQLRAQQLPTWHLTKVQNICDSSPWKLVIYDEFEGNTLNPDLWYSFNSNNNGKDDNWCEARIGYPGNYSIHKDENVIVKEGAVHLLVNQETNTWQCSSCDTSQCTNGFGDVPVTRNYTTGYISSTTNFNNGKIEARLKMPKFPHSWATCWTWHTTAVNEIDFAESTGGSDGYLWPHSGQRPSNNYYLHAWAPRNNIYALPDNMHVGNAYPGQSWWYWFTKSKKRHKMEDWHTYTCEWDTARIQFSLDNIPVTTFWKYYKLGKVPYFNGDKWEDFTVKIGKPCMLDTGEYKTLEGFPYNNNSRSKLIFSVGMTKAEKVKQEDGALGEMTIDYVKVYQRHPEKEGRIILPEGKETSFMPKEYENDIDPSSAKVVFVWVSDSTQQVRIYGISDVYAHRQEAIEKNIVRQWEVSISQGKDTVISHSKATGLFYISPTFKANNNGSFHLSYKDETKHLQGISEHIGFINCDQEILKTNTFFENNVYFIKIEVPTLELLDAATHQIISQMQIGEEMLQDPIAIQEWISKIKVEQLEPYIIKHLEQYLAIQHIENTKYSDTK